MMNRESLASFLCTDDSLHLHLFLPGLREDVCKEDFKNFTYEMSKEGENDFLVSPALAKHDMS